MSDLRKNLIRLAYSNPELRGDLMPLLKSAGRRLDSGLRNAVNRSLNKHGLDGNTYFRSLGMGLNAAARALDEHGLEQGEVFNAHMFMAPSGQRAFEIAFSNPEDPFSPEEVSNSMLVISWHKMDSGRYELVAYLS